MPVCSFLIYNLSNLLGQTSYNVFLKNETLFLTDSSENSKDYKGSEILRYFGE